MSPKSADRKPRAQLACVACRQNKRRCDRRRPCSNCVQRGSGCTYTDNAVLRGGHVIMSVKEPCTSQQARVDDCPSHQEDDVQERLERLEKAVFGKNISEMRENAAANADRRNSWVSTPVRLHITQSDDEVDSTSTKPFQDALHLLPPFPESRRLLEHLKGGSRPHWMVLHLPFAERLIDEIYAYLQRGESPPVVDLICTLAFLACSLFSWSGKLQADLGLSKAESTRACSAYSKAAESLIFSGSISIAPCMKCVLAVSNLAHLYLHSRGMGGDAMRLLMHCIGLMRLMDLSRLDTPARKRERAENGCDALEVEMLRRVWWNNVAHDWLGSFGGGLSDGSYIFSPKYMRIEIPAHTNDDCVTPQGITCCQPLSEPTDMSGAIFRIKMSELCREAADALPYEFSDAESVDYNVVLSLDQKFNAFRESLPGYLSLELPRTERAEDSKNYSSIPRLTMHFAILSRLCRLHRPYFMQSIRNPQYAFSHRACVAAAQEMLDIRVAMEQSEREIGVLGGFWTLLNHGFVAALVLATDVSFNDASPQAQRRRKQVLDMCAVMERSMEDGSGTKMEGVQRNLQTLIAAIKQRRAGSHGGSLEQLTSSQPVALSSVVDGISLEPDGGFAGFDNFMDIGHLLLDFVDLVPEMDGQQWDSFFENTYHGLGQSTQL